ncbi:hypothetical protein L210DRAFT_863915, partial [Boletus edulis BED1]
LDNASNNKTMMVELGKLLATCNIPFHAADQCIMCFPHIINLCSQDVIHAFDKTNLDGLDAMFTDLFDDPAEKNRFVAAITRLPIDIGQETVRCICASGLPRDQFTNIIISGNEKGWFHGPSSETIKVPQNELLCDVQTRWNLTYFMLRLAWVEERGKEDADGVEDTVAARAGCWRG